MSSCLPIKVSVPFPCHIVYAQSEGMKGAGTVSNPPYCSPKPNTTWPKHGNRSTTNISLFPVFRACDNTMLYKQSSGSSVILGREVLFSLSLSLVSWMAS